MSIDVIGKAVKELESYFKRRKGKKVEKRMENFYKQNFAEIDPSSSSHANVTNYKNILNNVNHRDVKSKVEKIESESRDLGVPKSALAGFCYLELIREGIKIMSQNDAKFSDKMEWQNFSNVNKELIEVSIGKAMTSGNSGFLNKGEFDYKIAYEKFEACEIIAERYELGEVFQDVAERNGTRIERRLRYLGVMEEAIEEGKPEEAEEALEEYVEFVENQKEKVSDEKVALKEKTEKWMKEG